MQQISRFPNLFGWKEIKMFGGTLAEITAKYGAGVQLCDGTNSTPDLRDKFIVGAKQDDTGVAKTNVSGALTKSGGSATKNLAHTHTLTDINTNELSWGAPEQGTGPAARATSVNAMTAESSGSATQDVLNPYYALCFITRTADWA